MDLTLANASQYVRRYVFPALGLTSAVVLEIAEVTRHSFVNWVFRVRLADGPLEFDIYLRQSRDHTKARPEVPMDAARAATEARILRLLSRIVDGVTPRVRWHDPDNNVLVLADIDRGAPLLADELPAGRVHLDCITPFAGAVAKVHAATRGIDHADVWGSAAANAVAMRTSQGLRFQPARELYPADVDRLLAASAAAEPGLVLGDLGPKNVFVDRGEARFLDLERAFVGDQSFDLGFLLAHYLAEVPPEARASGAAAARAFISAYRASSRELGNHLGAAFDRRLLGWLGVVLIYRVSGSYMGRPIGADVSFWRSCALSFLRANGQDAVVAIGRRVHPGAVPPGPVRPGG